MSEKKITVIVADDDIDTVELFSEFLELNDMKVVAKAFDGKEAIEQYKNFNPDIAFLDVMMPHYDGIYALVGIRQLNPLAKIVMVTADLTADTARRLENLKATGVVYKPFEFEEIISTVDRLVRPKSITV